MVAVLASASVAAAQPHKDPSPGTCDGKTLVWHLHRARVLLASAYDPARAEPSRSKVEAAQAHSRCIKVENTRRQLHAYRVRLAGRWQEAQQVAALTPYDCGSHGWFAIPCYVVDCESHYDWGAYNAASGATSVYQMLPSTYGSVCETCDWGHDDQHLAASRVWARSGGGEWSCA